PHDDLLQVSKLLHVDVVGAHPVAVHASQQLGALPAHAVPPLGGLQCSASLFTRHVVTPALVVPQQVTNPGFPQVDLAAHLRTAPRQLGFCSVASACCAAQLT